MSMDNALVPVEADGVALFEGGPKSPMQAKHKPFHYLSWAFHRIRHQQLRDAYFDPWEGKHLKSCQRIVAKARGNGEEIARRMKILWLRMQEDPDYWRFTPECLLGRWDDLHLPPVSAVGGRQAIARQARNAGWDRQFEELRKRHGGRQA